MTPTHAELREKATARMAELRQLILDMVCRGKSEPPKISVDDRGMCASTEWNWHPCGDAPPIEHFECDPCGLIAYLHHVTIRECPSSIIRRIFNQPISLKHWTNWTPPKPTATPLVDYIKILKGHTNASLEERNEYIDKVNVLSSRFATAQAEIKRLEAQVAGAQNIIRRYTDQDGRFSFLHNDGIAWLKEAALREKAPKGAAGVK